MALRPIRWRLVLTWVKLHGNYGCFSLFFIIFMYDKVWHADHLLFILFFRNLFPDGLPPSYVFVATLRYKGSLAEEEWDLWRVQTRDGKPQMAVTLNGFDHTVMFTTTSKAPNGIQTVTFSQQTAKVGNTVWRLYPLLFCKSFIKSK